MRSNILMDELYPATINSEVSNYNAIGGLKGVSGWHLARPGDFREFVENGFNPETDVHESFSSLEEIANFMRGAGDYSDRNSFFVDERDGVIQQEEGFFSPMYCEGCVNEIVSEASIEDERIDPEIKPLVDEHQADSFRPGYEKFVEEVVYHCSDHPESHLEMRRSWYEEE